MPWVGSLLLEQRHSSSTDAINDSDGKFYKPVNSLTVWQFIARVVGTPVLLSILRVRWMAPCLIS